MVEDKSGPSENGPSKDLRVASRHIPMLTVNVKLLQQNCQPEQQFQDDNFDMEVQDDEIGPWPHWSRDEGWALF